MQTVRFLGAEWLRAMDAAAGDLRTDTDFVVERVVTGVPERGEVRFQVHFSPAGGRVVGDASVVADVRLTTDYATAVALARGDTNAQEALSKGRLRIGGDVRVLSRHGDALAGFGDAFAAVRDQTVYE